MRSILIAVAVLLSARVQAHGEEAKGREVTKDELRAFLGELRKRSAGVKTLRVRFRQEKKLKLLRRPRRSTAELVFARGQVAVTTWRGASARRGDEKPAKAVVESRLLVSEGQLRIYYPSLQRLEIYPASRNGLGGADAGRRASLPLFTGDWKRLETDYQISMRRVESRPNEKSDESSVWLTLDPKDEKSRVTRIVMRLVEYRIREYTQEERGGTRVRMEIDSWKADEDVPQSELRLEVPPGTKEVRVAAGGRSPGS